MRASPSSRWCWRSWAGWSRRGRSCPPCSRRRSSSRWARPTCGRVCSRGSPTGHGSARSASPGSRPTDGCPTIWCSAAALADVVLLVVGDDVLVSEQFAATVGDRVLDPTRRAATVAAERRHPYPGRRGGRATARPHPGRRRGRGFCGARAWRWPSPTSSSASSSGARSARSRPSSTTAPTCCWTPSWPPPPRGTPSAPRPARPRPSWRRRSRRRVPCPPACARPRWRSSCTAASASPGSTTATSTCAGPSRSPRSSHRAGDAARDTARLVRDGVARTPDLDLPQEAERYRAEARAFVASLDGLDATARRARLVESGYLVPHWPPPWGRDASAAEQLVIEQELRGAERPEPRHHRLEHPDDLPARHARTGRSGGSGRRCAARSRGASCSPSRGPGRTPPRSPPAGCGWTAGGG